MLANDGETVWHVDACHGEVTHVVRNADGEVARFPHCALLYCPRAETPLEPQARRPVEARWDAPADLAAGAYLWEASFDVFAQRNQDAGGCARAPGERAGDARLTLRFAFVVPDA